MKCMETSSVYYMSPHHVAWAVVWLDWIPQTVRISTIIINTTAQHFKKEKGKWNITREIACLHIVTWIDQNRMATALAGHLLRSSGDDAVLPSWAMTDELQFSIRVRATGEDCSMSFSIYFFQRLSTRLWQSEETLVSDKLLCPLELYMHDWSSCTSCEMIDFTTGGRAPLSDLYIWQRANIRVSLMFILVGHATSMLLPVPASLCLVRSMAAC
jgi:hypothetical protein